ncbi:hypothetical protein KFL_000910055 [Klebsormidium nitens]|uniref:Uncharacterized protein n=1 Tax=Klebsormidium nitens TaxID=105231 RepID=A0A1Y1HT33_KLENI|nr:hypothetical protein KFL_000910055 [Klebsormidium nitens]|eukprot:GAQ81785.1 hypothetical protein KFL_000910055 [Klebsormidium nitens]
MAESGEELLVEKFKVFDAVVEANGTTLSSAPAMILVNTRMILTVTFSTSASSDTEYLADLGTLLRVHSAPAGRRPGCTAKARPASAASRPGDMPARAPRADWSTVRSVHRARGCVRIHFRGLLSGRGPDQSAPPSNRAHSSPPSRLRRPAADPVDPIDRNRGRGQFVDDTFAPARDSPSPEFASTPAAPFCDENSTPGVA